MQSDPLDEFVSGEYDTRPKPWQIRLNAIIFLIFGLVSVAIAALMLSDGLRDIFPRGASETAEAVIVGKSKGKCSSPRRRGKRCTVHWSFRSEDALTRRGFSGYEEVGTSFHRAAQPGDLIEVYFNPDRPNRPDAVKIVGYFDMAFLIKRFVGGVLLFSIGVWLLRKYRLSRRDPAAFSRWLEIALKGG